MDDILKNETFCFNFGYIRYLGGIYILNRRELNLGNVAYLDRCNISIIRISEIILQAKIIEVLKLKPSDVEKIIIGKDSCKVYYYIEPFFALSENKNKNLVTSEYELVGVDEILKLIKVTSANEEEIYDNYEKIIKFVSKAGTVRDNKINFKNYDKKMVRKLVTDGVYNKIDD